MGMQQQQLDQLAKKLKIKSSTLDDISLQVHPENHNALKWFLQVDDQFVYYRRDGQDVCQGLNVLAIQADAQMSERQYSPNDYLRLRALSREATKLLNKKQILLAPG